MPRVLTNLLLAGSLIGLAACANINTIARTTELDTSGNRGKAVHLDVQQRLLIVSADGKFCAEPSPDALAAYAASLGIGASAPGTGAASAAGGQQSSVASIGLRTQSITLMRDALFRMCEAYANGAVSPAQIATLLGRSQDLTAVILAVEQLTGAVTANQVALTGTTSASASASLLSNQKLLDAAREDETRKVAQLADARADLTTAEETRDTKADEEAAAKAERDRLIAPGSTATQPQKDQAERDWKRSEQDLERAQREVNAAENLVNTRETLAEEARRNRETIESAKDAALTAAAAGTTSSSEFSTPVQRNVLDKAATVAIAKAVESMVNAVIAKNYTEEACMAMITLQPRDFDKWSDSQRAMFQSVQRVCIRLITVRVNMEAEMVTTTSGIDPASFCIDAWLDGEGNRQKLRDWMRQNALNFSEATLITAAEYEVDRAVAIAELNIPCNS